jgi:hypothetical protein
VNLDLDEARRWLTLLHGTSEGLIWVGSVDNMAGVTRTDIEDVLAEIAKLDRTGTKGIYLRTTTLHRVPITPEGKRGRGEEGDSYTLPGFAADLDIAGPGHKTSKTLPPDETSAMAIVEASGLPEPTIWVHSGGGLYPWWMLQDPQDIRDPEALKRAKALSEKIQKILVIAGDSLGWHVGGEVGDMARILRIPGTINRKEPDNPRPCRILESAGYEHYSYSELETLVEALYIKLPKPTLPEYNPRPAVARTGLSPLDDWEAQSDWESIPGWPFELVDIKGHERRWLRIGSSSGARWSATTGHATDRDRLYVWTPETVFETRKPYNMQAAYVLLTEGSLSSDAFARATKDLASKGFGDQLTKQHRTGDLTDLVRPAVPAITKDAVDDQQPHETALIVEAGEPTSSHAVTLPNEMPEIDLGSEQESIVELTRAINSGLLPNVYVRDGRLMHLEPRSGVDGSQVTVSPVSPDKLNFLLAHHVRTFRYAKTNGRGDVARKAASAGAATLRAVVTSNFWPGVPRLAGVITTPTLRPDGSLIQDPGYDKATGLYFQPAIRVARVPDKITDEQVRTSREYVFGKVFGEFCWATPGDFANYLAVLTSPMLRPYIKTTTPFVMVTASTPGSGKTNLTDAAGLLYGQTSQVLPGRGEELQKKITSILAGNTSPLVVFDNLKEGTCISSEILATLITKDCWDDRLLGASVNIEARNDRLWLASGNGLTVGGDMASRTVMVRLDPRMPRPELRQFEMGQFSDWIREEGNREELLFHLLILVQSWLQAGANKSTVHTMRNFTRWAQIMGGFVTFHGLTGFLGNTDDLAELDTDAEEWTVFLAKWHQVFGTGEKLAKELHASAQIDYVMGTTMDRWMGCFITDEGGMTPTPKQLGNLLHGKADRFFGPYILRKRRNKTANSTAWWVERVEAE